MMQTILTVIGVVALALVVNALLKLTYNVLFFLIRKPWLWIAAVLMTAIGLWYLSALFDWSVSVPAWACTLAFFMNLPPSHASDNDQQAANEAADALYLEIGIRYGRLLYRAGLAAFVLASLCSWILFYGEICSGGDCIRIVDMLSVAKT